MRIRGGKISIKNKTLLLSFALILFLLVGAVSAADSADVSIKEDSNLDDDVQTSFSQDKLEISDEDSISETNIVNSQNDNLGYSNEAVVAGNGSNEYNGEKLQLSNVDENNSDDVMASNQGVSEIKASSSNDKPVSSSTPSLKNTTLKHATETYVLPNFDYGYTVILKTTDNVPISGAKIHFTYNNKKVTAVTDKDGKVIININLPKGEYDISYTFNGNSRYNKSSKTGKLHVQDSTVYFKASNLKMYYKDGSVFKVRLMDAKTKKPIANEIVKFTINGKTYERKTDSQGYAKLLITLAPGVYTVKIKHACMGREDYQLAYKDITVKKQVLLLKAYNFEMKYKKKSKSYYKVTVKLKGKYMKNVPVKFTIKGRSFIAKTNSKGIAKLRITAKVGYYSIKSVVHSYYYTSQAKYKHILVDGYKLVGKSVNTVEGKKVIYSVKVVNGRGKPIKNFKVYFSIDGNNYKSFSNKKGVAKVNLGKLDAGTHEIKFERGYASGTAKIYVKKTSPYLYASANCQVNNEKIKWLAAKLTSGKTSDYEKAKAIFNYVRDEISYSFYYDTRYGAVGTLDAGTGNCVDQSHLLVALYRAAELPARYVHGTCTFSSGNTYGHVWSQVLIGDDWVVADATSNRNSFGDIVNWNTNSYSLHGYYKSLPF